MPTHREVPALPLASWQMFSHGTTPRPDTILSAEHTCFTTSGRAAIALGLELLGVGPGHKVLVPTYHCPTMIAPIVKLGGSPLFYPLTSSGAPDLEYIQQHDEHPVTAMLVPHYFGLPQPMTKIRRLLRRTPDCAHRRLCARVLRSCRRTPNRCMGRRRHREHHQVFSSTGRWRVEN